LAFLSIAPEYDDRIEKLYWFGAKNSLEQQVAHDLNMENLKNRLTFIPVHAGKFRRETYRKSQLKNILDFFWLLMGVFQSIYFLLYYRINVVFCK
jgi:UDP-N-acetylglucosamine:LPS N-acetylglucosamine transferase